MDFASVTDSQSSEPPELNEHEFYQSILDGLARYLENAFVADVLETVSRFPVRNLAYGLNKNQITSKKWLIDALHQTIGNRLGTVYVLGGWYGVLGAMLLHDGRFDIDKVLSVDIDPSCREVAQSLNRTHVDNGMFYAVTADIYELNFDQTEFDVCRKDGVTQKLVARPDLIINTSCEHLGQFDRWYQRVPAGMPQILQSNNFYDCEEHVNCVPDIDSFRRQALMSELLFTGVLKLKRYSRFMLIGRK